MELVEAFQLSWRVRHPNQPLPDLAPLTSLLQPASGPPGGARAEIERRLADSEARISSLQEEITRECLLRDLLQQLAQRAKELETESGAERGGDNSGEQKGGNTSTSEKPGFWGRRKAKHSPSPPRKDVSNAEKEASPDGKAKQRGKKKAKKEPLLPPADQPPVQHDATPPATRKAKTPELSADAGCASGEDNSHGDFAAQEPDGTTRQTEQQGPQGSPPLTGSPKMPRGMRGLQAELAAFMQQQKMQRPLPPRPEAPRTRQDSQEAPAPPESATPRQHGASPSRSESPRGGQGAREEGEPSPLGASLISASLDCSSASSSRSNSPKALGERSDFQAKLAAIVQNNIKRNNDSSSPRSGSPNRENARQQTGECGQVDRGKCDRSSPTCGVFDRGNGDDNSAKASSVDNGCCDKQLPSSRHLDLKNGERDQWKLANAGREADKGERSGCAPAAVPPPAKELSSLSSESPILSDRHGRLPDLATVLQQESNRAPSPPQPPFRQAAAALQHRPHYEEIFAWPLVGDIPRPPERGGQPSDSLSPFPSPVRVPKVRRPDFREEFSLPSAAVAAYRKQDDVRGAASGTGAPRATPTGADNSSRFRELSPEEKPVQSVSSQAKRADGNIRRASSSDDNRVYGDVVVVASACQLAHTYPQTTSASSCPSLSGPQPRGAPPDYVQMSVPVDLPVFPVPAASDVVQSQTVPRPRKPPKPVPAPRKRPPVSPRRERGGGSPESPDIDLPAVPCISRIHVNSTQPASASSSSADAVRSSENNAPVTSQCHSGRGDLDSGAATSVEGRGDSRAPRQNDRGGQVADEGEAAARCAEVVTTNSSRTTSTPSMDKQSQAYDEDYSDCLSYDAVQAGRPEAGQRGAEPRLPACRGTGEPAGCGDTARREVDPARPSPHALPTPQGSGAPPPGPGGSQSVRSGRDLSQPAARADTGQGGQRLVTFHPLPLAPAPAPDQPACRPAPARPAPPIPHPPPGSLHPDPSSKSEVGSPPAHTSRGAQPEADMRKFSSRKAERKDLDADGYGAPTLHGTYRRIPDSASSTSTRSDGSSPRPASPGVDYETSDSLPRLVEDLDGYSMLSRVDRSLEGSPELGGRAREDDGSEGVVLRKKLPPTCEPKSSSQEPVYARVKKKKVRSVSYENWTINALVSRPLDSTESSEGEEDLYDNVPPSPTSPRPSQVCDKVSSDSGLSEDIVGRDHPPPSGKGLPVGRELPSLPNNLQGLRDLNTDDDDAAGDDERERSDSGDSDKNEDNVSITSDIIFIPGSNAGRQGEQPPSPLPPCHQDHLLSSEEESTSNKSYDELDALPLPPPMSQDEVKLQMRLLIVKGVLDSEKSYLSILSLLMTYKRSLEASSKTSQPVISSEDIKSIFCNLSALCTIHQNFVEGLESFIKKGDAQADIGDIFKTMIVHLPRFGEYMENYPQAVATIQRCSQENLQFQEIAQKVTFSSAGKEITNLEDALFKPVQRLQRNTLVLHDLLKHTPETHRDFQTLKRALQLAQHNLESFGSNLTKQTNQQEEKRHLVKSSFFVELVNGTRKLRCIFLFTDIIVCTKREAHRNKVTFDCKWFIPLSQLEYDTRFSYGDDQKHLHREEVQELKRKIGQLKTELKAEMKKEEDTRDKHWSLSGMAAARGVEKRKKKIQELEGQMILASPRLPFKLWMEGGKNYTLLMTTDYEREEWMETLTALNRKCTPDQRTMNAIYVQELVNSVKELPQVNKIGSVIMQKDEETLDGTLNVTVHKLNGLTESTAAETYCCLEMDSYGHFFMKARTHICPATADPAWNEDFELELDGTQTLRILAYQKRPDSAGDVLLGRGAVELSKSWLTSNFQEKTISLNEVSLVISVRHTPADKTMRRTPSQQKSAVFGVKIATCTRREGKTVPTIVTACLAEVERRGLEEIGIYRVSGVSSEVQSLKKMFDKNVRAAVNAIAETDINAVTGVLKLYFRELPEPLFSEASYSKFVDAFYVSDQDAKERCMLDLLHSLPDANYYCIVTLAEHLIKVSQKDHVNKMSLHNLSTIFGPTLLAPASGGLSCSPADLISKGAEDVMIQAGIIHAVLSILASGRSLRRSAPC